MCNYMEIRSTLHKRGHLPVWLDEQIFISSKLCFAKYCFAFSSILKGLYRYIWNIWDYKSMYVLIHFFSYSYEEVKQALERKGNQSTNLLFWTVGHSLAKVCKRLALTFWDRNLIEVTAFPEVHASRSIFLCLYIMPKNGFISQHFAIFPLNTVFLTLFLLRREMLMSLQTFRKGKSLSERAYRKRR